MKIVGEIDLNGIKKIVINRLQVWELEVTWDEQLQWRKTEGGPGYQTKKDLSQTVSFFRSLFQGSDVKTMSVDVRKVKTPAEMMETVNEILDRRVPAKVKGAKNVKVLVLGLTSEERAYRCWPCGDTLNIVRKDLK